jgi:hypothetical protein
MPNKLIYSDRFKREFKGFIQYLSKNGKKQEFTDKISFEIEQKIENMIAHTPTLNAYHPHFGAPYRALLYKFSPQSTYWIIYTINDKDIDLLSFWHASLDPASL